MSYQSGWESFRLSDAAVAPDAAPTAFLDGRIQHPELTDVNFQTDSESIPDNFVGDETVEVERQGFESPKPPPKGWTQLEEVVTAYREAADACNHRFIVCCCTSGHVSKKLGSVKVTDYAFLYCKCAKEPPGYNGVKPHDRSFCPWNVKLKFVKHSMTWSVVSSVDQHSCQPLPNYAITATGMHMLRTHHDLTSEELLFIRDQFDNVGTYPRLIQWNFSRKFPNRKPTSELVSSLRLKHQEEQYGLHADNVATLQKTLESHNAKGGVGKVEWDTMMQISRMCVLRPDMVPFLKKYGRILICDATHGITMAKFRLFTVVVVDSLLHSTLVAYAFIRTEASAELDWIFTSLGLKRGDVVFITDDNPAARILCANFNWIHILCQWHYARNWVKACNKARISRNEQFHFGETLFHLMTSVDFNDDEDFSTQLGFFVDAVIARSEHMREWATSFRNDIKLVAEWWRKGLYTAGAPPTMYILVYHVTCDACPQVFTPRRETSHSTRYSKEAMCLRVH